MLLRTCVGIGLMFSLLAQAAERPPSPSKIESERPPSLGPGRGGPAGGPRPSSQTADPTIPSEVLNARFQVTVYEVGAAEERLADLHSGALAARAATAEGLLKALSDLGTARILYRIDQPANVYGENISIGSTEPMVTAARQTPSGQSIKSVQYLQVGISVRLAAQPSPGESGRKTPDVRLTMELSALAAGDVEIAPGIKAPITQKLSLEHSERLEYNQPRVALLVNSTKSDEQTPATLYAIRYMFAPLTE